MIVSELITWLQTQDPSAVVWSTGPDMGGYDVEDGEVNQLNAEPGKVWIIHSDYERYQEYLEQQKLLRSFNKQ